MSLLAVDIGGSGSRIRVTGVTPVEVKGPALAVRSGRPDYASVLETLAGSIPADQAPDIVAVGAAGVLSLGDPEEIARLAGRLWRTARIVVVPDVLAGLVGAWGLEGGAIVAAGTGAIGMSTDFRNVWRRSDGWGHLLGDAGSGAWIGARGLDASLRRLDRRAGGSELLLTAARDLLGDPEGLPAMVRSAANEASVLASFAPSVISAAEAGDDIAIQILDQAGWRLAETATSLLADGVPQRVALVGGIAAAGDLVTASFRRGVEAAVPNVELVIGGGEILDGVEAVARHVLSGELAESRPRYVSIYPSAQAIDPQHTIHKEQK